MTSDLLKKEDEFYKENEKLELRTKELMQRVNDVMKIQDNLVIETFKTKSGISNAKQNSFFTTSEPETILTKKELEGLNLPTSVNEMGAKGISHFYRAKIKSTQAEHQRLDSEYKKKCEELKKVQKENQNLLEEKEKWFISYSTSKNAIGKMEAQNTLANSKLQTKESENAVLKKEVEQLKKEIKNLNLSLNTVEVRLNRSYEENEKLKSALKIAKEEDKESNEAHRKQINELSATVKHIEKHKAELLNGFKKQMQLITNLKKQKFQIEALKAAEMSEAEFLKILDFKLE